MRRGAVLGLLLLTALFGQEYHWPTEAGKNVTATFGDVRPRRYHAGLDISTGGANGHPINAVADGFVERILVSTEGYGRAVYLRLADGRLAVYAHLQQFMPRLNELVVQRQARLNKYALDLRFRQTDFPVLKGDIIGFTGDTGTINGPHLHFELRSPDNRPLNPLTNGFELEDKGLPLFRSLAVIPMGPGVEAHGSMLPSVLRSREVKPGIYVIDDTIAVTGPVGLAVQAFDRVPGMRYFHTLYGLSLSVDGRRVYTVQFDQFNFREGPMVDIERDYRLAQLADDDYHRLFSSAANDGLSFVKAGSASEINLTPGYHRFAVKIWDKEQNSAILRGVLSKSPPTSLEVHSDWSDDEDGWVVTLKSDSPLRKYDVFFFTTRGKEADSFTYRPKSGTPSPYQFVVPGSKGNKRILQIIGTDRWGARLAPVHVSLIPIEEVTQERQFSLQIEHGNRSMALQINSDLYLPFAPDVILISDSGATRYQTHMVSPTSFLLPTLGANELIGLKKVIVRVNLQPAYEAHIPVRGVVAAPEDRTQVRDADDLLRLEYRPGTFYDSTFVFFKPVDVEPPDSGSFVIKPVQIGPLTAPYRGPMGIQMKVPKNRLLPDNAAIYYLDEEEGWSYMKPAGLASRENLVKTRAYRTLATSSDVYALIEEHQPPTISVRFPGKSATYNQNDVSRIRMIIKDDLAGLDNENAITVKLDGQALLFEYNSLRDAVNYRLPTQLEIGDHQLTVWAIDRVGNVAQDTVNFTIR